jgi:hypothetical protein
VIIIIVDIMTKLNSSGWFNVDKEGFSQLQNAKPKHYVVRELIQNVFDTDSKTCKVDIVFTPKITTITVIDENPDGFKDLADAFTLFKHSDKRSDPQKRGRFNIGEKQAFAICDSASITTTKGQILFTEKGRIETDEKTKMGTVVSVKLKMTKDEYDETIKMLKMYISPRNIKYYINNQLVKNIDSIKSFEMILPTELESNGIIKSTKRKTNVQIYDDPLYNGWIFELGIPVCQIECQYGIDVQQKIPLGIDRESIKQSYLKEIYAAVLNNTYGDITKDTSSMLWVREATSSQNISKEAAQTVIEKRYGDKVVIANHFDPNSIDKAISNGYKVLEGSELSSDEWSVIKSNNLIQTSTKLFGEGSDAKSKNITPNENMIKTGEYAKKIAKKFLGIDITVKFIEVMPTNVIATFKPEINEFTFHVNKLPLDFFDVPVSSKTTDLIIHELGHKYGNHVETAYIDALTRIGSELIFMALDDPDFFKNNT